TTSRILEGIFVTAPTQLQMTGSISLTLQADVGIAKAGGTGTLSLTFGIQGLHEETAMPGSPGKGPYHVAHFGTGAEKVLQLGDILYDVTNGGPLCAFEVGGSIRIGLQGFLTIGIDPFSVTFSIDFGNFTIATLSIDTCSSNPKPIQLAEAFDSSSSTLSS